MATISNTPRPGYAWDATDNCWYPIGTGPHTHADYITSSSAINPTIVDAKGDIIAATAADTPARLAVGTNGQYLSADSTAATGLAWASVSAGGMTLLSTTSLSGSSVSLSSISQDYTNLYLYVYGITSSGDFKLRIAPNGSTNICAQASAESDGSSVRTGLDTYIQSQLSLNNWGNQINNSVALNIFNYSNTSGRKPFSISSGFRQTSTNAANGGGIIDTTSAISSLVLTLSSGTTFSTGTALLYGVK